ncbi:hypothetical protein FOD75_10910 (plasmid) [Limosilactobacillus reuteri]|uniref:Uncharacterized protein n=1 Tax=Limosilactobacillus reuteri TaxID=1598 RepID=A0A517D8C2_LIMRT|nr:hypothetical protein [Limosilactobacillus reuteri]QDR73599.1 hypothetical protein FOD75_10910 [Limosilactobacillus reuteri]
MTVEFIQSKHDAPIRLNNSHLLLLQLIGNLGFVNRNQIDMLWSVCVQYPVTLTPLILAKWCKRGGLLRKVEKPTKSSSKNQLNRPVYLLTNKAKDFLVRQGLWQASWLSEEQVGLNSHNEQAIEVIVQGLYAAAFNADLYGLSVPTLNDGTTISLTRKLINTDDNDSYLQVLINQVSAGGAASNQPVKKATKLVRLGPVAQPTPKELEQPAGGALGKKAKITTGTDPVARPGEPASNDSNTTSPHDLIKSRQVLATNPVLVSELKDALVLGTPLPNYLHTYLDYLVNLTTSDNSMTTSVSNDTDNAIQTSEGSSSPTKPSETTTDIDSFSNKAAGGPAMVTADKRVTANPQPNNNFENQNGQGLSDNLPLTESSNSAPKANRPAQSDQLKAFDSMPAVDADTSRQPTKPTNHAQYALDLLLGQPESHSSTSKVTTNTTELTMPNQGTKPSGVTAFDQTNSTINQQNTGEKTEFSNRQVSSAPRDSEDGGADFAPLRSQIGANQVPDRCQPKKVPGNLPKNEQNTGEKTEFLNRQVSSAPRDSEDGGADFAPLWSQIGANQVPDRCQPKTVQNRLDQQLTTWLKWAPRTADANATNLLPKIPKRFREGQSWTNHELIYQNGMHLTDYNFASFSHQMGITYGKARQLPFLADQMVSLNRDGQAYQLFIELDNRTESNATQVQKILNYIWYALDHPGTEIMLIIATNDGSLSSKRLDGYQNVSRRLANLASRLLKTYVKDSAGQPIYLSTLFESAPNLTIRLTGVSEAYVDVAEFMDGANYALDYVAGITEFSDLVNQTSEWQAKWQPNAQYENLLADADVLSGQSKIIQNQDTRGLGRYLSFTDPQPTWGNFVFTHPQSGMQHQQPLIFGQEHDLGTMLATNHFLTADKQTQSPIILYPHRQRTINALTLPEYKSLLNSTGIYTFDEPLLVQPRYGVNNDPVLHSQLRWLMFQYQKLITNYFKQRDNQADWQQDIIEWQRYRLIDPLSQQPVATRSFTELHELSGKLSSEDFIKQLRINEVPLKLFRQYLDKWPEGLYTLPVIKDLHYWNNQLERDANQVPPIVEVRLWLSSLNSTTPEARIHPRL